MAFSLSPRRRHFRKEEREKSKCLEFIFFLHYCISKSEEASCLSTLLWHISTVANDAKHRLVGNHRREALSNFSAGWPRIFISARQEKTLKQALDFPVYSHVLNYSYEKKQEETKVLARHGSNSETTGIYRLLSVGQSDAFYLFKMTVTWTSKRRPRTSSLTGFTRSWEKSGRDGWGIRALSPSHNVSISGSQSKKPEKDTYNAKWLWPLTVEWLFN